MIPRNAPDMGAVSVYLAGLGALATITGVDLTPWPPWQNAEDGDWHPVTSWVTDGHFTWMQWYRAHRSETPAQWHAAGEARARAALSSAQVAPRFAAIARLVDSPADRAAVVASVDDLLTHRRITRAGRAYITRFAQQHALLTTPDAGASTDAAP